MARATPPTGTTPPPRAKGSPKATAQPTPKAPPAKARAEGVAGTVAAPAPVAEPQATSTRTTTAPSSTRPKTRYRTKPAKNQHASTVKPLPLRIEQVERTILDQGQEVLTTAYCWPDAAGRACRLLLGYKTMSIYLDRGGRQVSRVRWSELAHALAQVETLEGPSRKEPSQAPPGAALADLEANGY